LTIKWDGSIQRLSATAYAKELFGDIAKLPINVIWTSDILLAIKDFWKVDRWG
jgi:hypothetical protein